MGSYLITRPWLYVHKILLHSIIQPVFQGFFSLVLLLKFNLTEYLRQKCWVVGTGHQYLNWEDSGIRAGRVVMYQQYSLLSAEHFTLLGQPYSVVVKTTYIYENSEIPYVCTIEWKVKVKGRTIKIIFLMDGMYEYKSGFSVILRQ